MDSPGETPSTRKNHQQGQPREGLPPGMKSMVRVVWLMETFFAEPPSNAESTQRVDFGLAKSFGKRVISVDSTIVIAERTVRRRG